MFAYIFFLPLTWYFINPLSQIDPELTKIEKKIVKNQFYVYLALQGYLASNL